MLTGPVSHSSPLVSSHPETEQNLQCQLQEAAIRGKGTAIPVILNIGILIGATATSFVSGKEDARLVLLGGFCFNALWNLGVYIHNNVKKYIILDKLDKIHQIQRLQATQQSSANFDPDATP